MPVVNLLAPPQPQDDFPTLLAEWMCNNQSAIDFLNRVFFIAATWDDLIDQDKLVIDKDIHSLIETALMLNMNAFYAQYTSILQPILMNSIRNWKAANLIEQDETSTSNARMNAFIIRSSYIDLIGFCAALINGQEWGIHVTVAARIYVSREGFSAYLTSLTREKELRHGSLRRN